MVFNSHRKPPETPTSSSVALLDLNLSFVPLFDYQKREITQEASVRLVCLCVCVGGGVYENNENSGSVV